MDSGNETRREAEAWRALELPLKTLAQALPAAVIYTEKLTAIEINYYLCQPVMDVANFLRTATKAQELAGQHHTLKILFKYLIFGDRGQMEYRAKGGRLDIFLSHENKIIEVKTVTQMTFRKLYRQVIGVIGAEPPEADVLWVFFFYKFKKPCPKAPKCLYLLTFISIDLLTQEKATMRWELAQMVEETKRRVAEKLEMTPELIIPLENLLKVEDLEQDVRVLKDQVKGLTDRLSEKDQKLADKDQKLAEMDQEIQKLKAKLR